MQSSFLSGLLHTPLPVRTPRFLLHYFPVSIFYHLYSFECSGYKLCSMFLLLLAKYPFYHTIFCILAI